MSESYSKLMVQMIQHIYAQNNNNKKIDNKKSCKTNSNEIRKTNQMNQWMIIVFYSAQLTTLLLEIPSRLNKLGKHFAFSNWSELQANLGQRDPHDCVVVVLSIQPIGEQANMAMLAP